MQLKTWQTALLAVLLGACSQTPTLETPARPEVPGQKVLSKPGVTAKPMRYATPEASAEGRAAWGGGRAAWGGGRAAWGGGRPAWGGGDTSITLAENYGAWKQIHLDTAQKLAPKLGAGVMVAVIDTGVDVQHTAFAGRLSDPALWRDFVAQDNDPSEEGIGGTDAGFGHGTGVAGVVLQVAPNTKILPIRALGKDGSGDTTQIASAIKYAVSAGAQIINLSLGTIGFDCDLQKTIAQDVPDSVILVISAGNNNSTEITYPAATSKQSPNSIYNKNPEVRAQVEACDISPAQNSHVKQRTIGVGSVSTLQTDQKSDFSNYGPGLELLAPGENILTTAPDGFVCSWSGTSFAAPMVAGAFALALAEQTDSSKLLELAQNVVQTSDKIDDLNPSYPSESFGNGRLNIEALMLKVLAGL